MAEQNWFAKLSPAAQKAYIAKHPNSIYAKKGKAPAAGKPKSKTKSFMASRFADPDWLKGQLATIKQGIENTKRRIDAIKMQQTRSKVPSRVAKLQKELDQAHADLKSYDRMTRKAQRMHREAKK